MCRSGRASPASDESGDDVLDEPAQVAEPGGRVDPLGDLGRLEARGRAAAGRGVAQPPPRHSGAEPAPPPASRSVIPVPAPRRRASSKVDTLKMPQSPS